MSPFNLSSSPSPALFLTDPQKWSIKHVEEWLEWAVQEFGLNQIEISKFRITGAQLCSLSREEMLERAPPYTGDMLYSHLNLLRARNGETLHHRLHRLTVLSNRHSSLVPSSLPPQLFANWGGKELGTRLTS